VTDLTDLWVEQYLAQRSGSVKRNREIENVLEQMMVVYRAARVPPESFSRSTDFLLRWAQARKWASRPDKGARFELICLRGFTDWLFRTGRTDDNVYHYVRPIDEAALRGDIPRLSLCHNLQRDIAHFRPTLVLKDRTFQITAIQAAHSWNLHLNVSLAGQDCVEVNEDTLLSWTGKVCAQAPSLRRAGFMLKGLEAFLNYLVDHQKMEGNLATDLLRKDVRRSPQRIAKIVASAGTCEVAVIKARLGSLDRFRSGLKGDFLRCLDHLKAQKLVVPPYAQSLGRFDRVLLHYGIERAEDITAEAIEHFLSENGAAPATRNQRLVRIRRFFQFLVRQGRELSVPWEQWRRVTVPTFRPHIYSLKEISSLLELSKKQNERVRDPILWLGVELVLYLCYAAGLRLSEPLSLRVRDVQLDRDLLFIARTKFHKQRWIPYEKATAQRLREYSRQRSFLFPERSHPEEPFFLNGAGLPLLKPRVGKLFRKLVDQEMQITTRGTRSPRIHDLRHSFAVHRLYKWYSDGADVQNKLPLLSAYMGHVHIRHTEVYLHLAEDLLRQAGRGFERTFQNVIGERTGQ
jgi:site-specific recombinase XerD